MNGLAILDWCRSRPGVTEELPFGPDVRVFKLWGRMFAACPAGPDPAHVSLKCDPRFAEHLRAEHEAITAAYHMSKRHWNTVRLAGRLADGMVEDLLGHSYTLVLDGLPRRYRALANGRTRLDEAAYHTGDFAAAEAPLADARRLAEAAGDQRCLAASLDQLGILRHWRNLETWNGDGFPKPAPEDVAEELGLVEQGLAIRRTLGHEAEIGESVFHVGLVHQLYTGCWDQAERCFAEARRLAEASGNRWLLFEARRHLGAVSWHSGDFDNAIAHFTASLDQCRRIGMPDTLPLALVALGRCALAAGRIPEGIEHLRQGVELGERRGLRARMMDPPRRALAAARAAQQEGGG
jgi:predicted DNA-binding protein (MmcQ/YjbR family)